MHEKKIPMLGENDHQLMNVSDAKRIEILTWNAHDMLVGELVRLTGGSSSLKAVELVPLHGNITAIESILDVTDRDISDTFLRVDSDTHLHCIDACEFQPLLDDGEVSSHPTYRVIVAGRELVVDKPSAIDYLGKLWNWSELFFNFSEAFHIPLQRSADDPLLPKEFLVEKMRDNMGISDGLDSQIILDEMVRVGILKEIEFELYRFIYNDPRMIRCMNWSGHSVTNFPENTTDLIQYLVALTNRTPHIHSREYLDLLNHLQYLRGVPWDSLPGVNNRKMLLDLYFLLMKQIDWATDTYELAQKEKFFFELKDGKRVFPKTIRDAILETSDMHNTKVSLEIMCALKWTLSGRDDLDVKIMHYACSWFCKQTMHVDQNGILHLPSMLKGALKLSPFNKLLEPHVQRAKKVAFYDLVISLF
jgi:hypothetical protein